MNTPADDAGRAALLKIANDSGFPLQIAVERQVRETHDRHGWNVLYVEHSWSNPLDNTDGFIDLVLQASNKVFHLVVECKRVRESVWLFLNSEGHPKARRHGKAWVSWYGNDRMLYDDWADLPVDPSCPEAQYCAIRGQTASERNTLLERLGGGLVSATEAVAREHRDYRPEGDESFKIFLNVVVTTADLQFGTFDPATISLTEGAIPDATFQSVPYVRLRKQLSTRPNILTPTDYSENKRVAYSKENTVFVVRADALVEFIEELDVPEQNVRGLYAG
jgi:hypothetical protein